MDSKYAYEKMSTWLAIREMKKTTVKYDMPIRTARIKNSDNTKC